MSAAAAGGAAAAAAVANAIKASGTVVQVAPTDFTDILRRIDKPIIIRTESGIFKTTYKFITSYRGFAFYTKSAMALLLPDDAEIINAKSVWTPS